MNNSVVDQNISTHHVNLLHYEEFQYKPDITLDGRYAEFEWIELAVAPEDEKLHPYMHN